MGVAGYSEMAHMLGLYDVAEKYAGIAKKMEEVSEKKLFQKKLSKTFGGYDKISYLCIRFRKRWQNINESSLKDLR